MANKILFVFEGQELEGRIVNSLTNFFLNDNTIVKCVFCQDIYYLFDLMQKDADLDLFVLLKEKPENKDILQDFNRTDFAEIFLFFDYDGHATEANDEKIKELLELFNNETEAGMLYISYPMVEAYKHLHPDTDFKTIAVQAKKNIRYKNLVHEESHNTYNQHFSKFTFEIWKIIIQNHLMKMNYIVNDNYSFPEVLTSQSDVFENQLVKFIVPNAEVSVLSSFPPMILDYYGIIGLKSKFENK